MDSLGYAWPGLTVQSSYKENPAICQDCPAKSVYSKIVCWPINGLLVKSSEKISFIFILMTGLTSHHWFWEVTLKSNDSTVNSLCDRHLWTWHCVSILERCTFYWESTKRCKERQRWPTLERCSQVKGENKGRDQLQALVLEGLLLESQLKGLSKDGQG